MLRLIFSLLIFSSCSMGTIKKGGERSYIYNTGVIYTSDELRILSPEVITTLKRDPQVGKLKQLFSKNQKPIKRIGIIVFETRIQPTLDGLAGKNQIYMTPAGKQILTESMLRIWEQSIRIISPDLDYVPTSKITRAKSHQLYGRPEDDYVMSDRSSLAPDDIFYMENGKKTTTTTVVNPRGMRDVSFLLVPAYELMGGPKWSEHNKQFLNDVSKELKLDAAIVIMSDLSWTAAHTDKHSGEVIPEEIKVKIKSSTLVPLHQYHERLDKLNINDRPNVTLCYRSYESEIKVPALISAPLEIKNFDTIESELVAPMLKTYKDLSQMTLMRITEDLKKTW